MKKKNRLLLISFVLLFILPYIASIFKWGGPPPGYGLFPAQKVVEDPGFNLLIFILFSIVEGIVYLFILFPQLFGFKKAPAEPVTEKIVVGYPRWFKLGLIMTLVSWAFMWGRFKLAYPTEHFTFVPLWWGFILVLDGVVYKRNNGKSLMSTMPNTMKIMAATSSFSWFVFEYLNFFVCENWYYPNNMIFTNFGNISWQLLSYTTVLPAIFEWYWLLRTFKGLRDRYSYGPKISFSKPTMYVLMVLGLALTFLMAIFPDELFWVLWVSLVPALVPGMEISKLWTPFSDVSKKGDWSPLVLIGIATLLNGFFWEFWNFGSEWFHNDAPTNPNYWKYSVPYVDKFHIFSEMPLLGYCGYIFFGIVCWVLWLAVAYLVGFDPTITGKNKNEVAKD